MCRRVVFSCVCSRRTRCCRRPCLDDDGYYIVVASSSTSSRKRVDKRDGIETDIPTKQKRFNCDCNIKTDGEKISNNNLHHRRDYMFLVSYVCSTKKWLSGLLLYP